MRRHRLANHGSALEFWRHRRTRLLSRLVELHNAQLEPPGYLVDAFAGVCALLRGMEDSHA